ncbi:hypothetical protein U9M48_008870 [Paspalum notatum var. saurae]|uniref:Uncharacterized protein n=1 Tax=Paspalum notatum var. saurae TaxID=547442 RepID=A0AAQ3WE36_PASNO
MPRLKKVDRCSAARLVRPPATTASHRWLHPPLVARRPPLLVCGRARRGGADDGGLGWEAVGGASEAVGWSAAQGKRQTEGRSAEQRQESVGDCSEPEPAPGAAREAASGGGGVGIPCARRRRKGRCRRRSQEGRHGMREEAEGEKGKTSSGHPT